ncbi:sensor histidine kinase [Naumannella halotolerans]|uniref:Signal transduction histidine-protein kinase/phosphatase MprB n=1 Tax=Naumannella halotolerans TaxID=993414 RepID=A0A4R7J263_9ACTN|nr:HAMP domain-containing sensor histidine kinase [Naumannella halotolerans]TDT31230.1 signal transduction histidine kinase [Naumannella halotolerans]
MRNRILVPLLSCALLALIAAAVPSLGLMAQRRTEQMISNRTQVLERVAELARSVEPDRATSGSALETYVERHRQIHREHLLILDSTGQTVHSTGGLDKDSPQVSTLLRTYGFTPPRVQVATIQPWSPDRALMAVPIEMGNDLSGGVVVLQADLTGARRDIRLAWLFALGMVLLLAGVLVMVTSAWSRWVVRPVLRLDEAANRLSTGQRPEPVQTAGPPELRRLARSFDSMAQALTSTVEQQQALIADTSHQLRNPIAAVRLRVDLLQQSATTQQEPSLHQVQADLDRLEDTVDRLLVLAELDHQINAEPLGSAVSKEISLIEPEVIVHHWQARATAAGVRLRAVGEPVQTRARGAEEMIDNLLDNACKYAGEGATVWLRARREADQVLIMVEDSGSGLAETELRYVGHRFWRSSRHTDRAGTGLGLSLVITLARASGGTAEVTRSDHGGLAIRLTLPAVER